MKLSLAAALLVTSAIAFTPSTKIETVPRSAVPTTIENSLKASFLENLPNPFDNSDASIAPKPPSTPPPISNEPEALFSRARAILSCDLGIKDASFLADNFVWIGPNAASSGPLDKEEYLAAGKFFNIRGAFPDLDYRAHDFRLDPEDPLTVRLTARTVGTMRGELRLRSETLPPTGVRMVCPPEAISMTFDEKTGKLVKLCSGFTMDRLVGNTGGLCGVMAAATVAGSPPSEWEVYPPATVIARFFGRSVQQLSEPEKVFLAPFPETVMIQLAKGVLNSEFGSQDPDLLADEFTFCGPFIGPLKKDDFVKQISDFNLKAAFPDLDEGYSNFRVDPYDPYRIWFDAKGTGTRTGALAGVEANGAKYVGPPEAGSLTFDDDGFCTRLTAGAVMDPTQCNTGGLGGVFGILVATGVPLPPLTSRPLPQAISSLQSTILSPLTGKSSDDVAAPAVPRAAPEPQARAPPPKPPPPVAPKLPPPPVEEKDPVIPLPFFAAKPAAVKESAPKKPVALPSPKKPSKPAPKAPPKEKVDVVAKQKAALRAAEEKRIQRKAEAEAKKKEAAIAAKAAAEQKRAEAEEKKRQAAAQATKSLAEQRQATAEARKAEAEEKRKQVAEAARALAEERKAAAEARKKDAEAKRAAALAANELKKKEMEQKRAAALAANEAKKTIAKAQKGATISLGFFNFGAKSDDESSFAKAPTASAKAPVGVPTLTKWYQNSDGSITGLVSGSKAFAEGESITTSPLPTNNPSKESVVTTISGSKYYLDGKPSSAPWFGLFGGGASAAKPESKTMSTKSAAAVAAEKRKQAAEEKKAAAEAKRAQFEAAKIAKQEAAAQKKAAMEAKRAEAQAKLAAQREKAQAAQLQKKKPVPKKVDKKAASILANNRGGTISLQPLKKSSPGPFGKKAAATPPRGVPVISKFKANRDGSVTGLISGSTSFNEGERVTTSKLAPNQKIEAGNVVTTVSGSKYFLK